ncbi:MAG: glycosyltransferase family 9 protein [Pseudanabaenaceae cyanobacterium bins.39]|nr:glycosyltransferase family 9 protein [Pseudanabaenaceae cyanobacterium bins.39]
MMRILALIVGGTGEQLMFLPTLDTLKQKYPSAEIDVVVEPRAMATYRICQSVNRVWKFDFADRNSLADFGNLLGTIRDREYDVAITNRSSFFTNLLLWLSGIPKRIGFAGAANYLLTDAIAPSANTYKVLQNLNLLSALDIQNLQLSQTPITVNLLKSDLDWAAAEQKRLGIDQSGFILFNCGTNGNYPATSWAAIGNTIQSKMPNIPIVAVDSINNADLLKQLNNLVPNLIISSPTDIGKLAALIATANLFICAEGDAMQLAVAVGTALVAILGDGISPALYLPIHEPRIKYVQAKAGQALSTVSPEAVLEVIWQGN